MNIAIKYRDKCILCFRSLLVFSNIERKYKKMQENTQEIQEIC